MSRGVVMRVMSEEKLNKLAEFIKQYARENNGESPSLADIMDYMGMVKSTAYRHVLELEKRGVISYTGKKTLSSPLQRKMNTSELLRLCKPWLSFLKNGVNYRAI